MDEALQLVIEMDEHTWQRFKAELDDVAPEEIDWRPLPQANTMNAILKHLRVEAEWYVASLEHGEQSPYRDLASVQRLVEAVPLDFARNLQALEELHTRFTTALRRTRWPPCGSKPCAPRSFPAGHPILRIS